MDERPKAEPATEPRAEPEQKKTNTTASLRVRSHIRAGFSTTLPNF